ncbi:hypothetical protein [Halogeometricum sp. CBA1124]|uniref:hypothetical protein n=1 Tax=Halogeometricum sp. CBA1124 TaxID=2668071 RepID=UPI00142A33EC|nr:hypothetical protein [Halogeometricum sp. CBA1124]
MRLRTELLVAVAVFVALGALARTPAGRFVLPLVSLAVLGGMAYLLTRDPAYARTTVGARTRLLDSREDGAGDGRADGADGADDGRENGAGDDGVAPGRVACIDCGAPATTTRRFVREFVVLGVPLVLLDDGTNRYCDDCLP